VPPAPLAPPGGRGRAARPDQGDLEGGAIDDALDPRQVRPPADELEVRRGPVRMSPGQENDPLEEAGLAGGVGTPDEVRPGPERGLERFISPKVGQPDRGERGGSYDVVRTGITT